MFQRFRKGLTEDNSTGTTLKLPMEGLRPIAEFYEHIEGERTPITVIVLYNVEQLAAEIAKQLKNSTNDCREGNNDSK